MADKPYPMLPLITAQALFLFPSSHCFPCSSHRGHSAFLSMSSKIPHLRTFALSVNKNPIKRNSRENILQAEERSETIQTKVKLTCIKNQKMYSVDFASKKGSKWQRWRVGPGPGPVGLWIVPEYNDGKSLKVFKQESEIFYFKL